jgi:hypothetical protein
LFIEKAAVLREIAAFLFMLNVLWLVLGVVEQTLSHYKYDKTFNSAADFPQENPEKPMK